MVIGGFVGDFGEPPTTNDIELVSLDGSPVPDCLSDLSPFPYGDIIGGAGGASTLGMKRVVQVLLGNKDFFNSKFCIRWSSPHLWGMHRGTWRKRLQRH